MNKLQNLAKYRRFLLDATNLLVVRGNISPVLSGMHAYNMRHRITPPPESLEPVVEELLAATALSAVSLADRESWGWSLTFKGMQDGFFVGLEPEGMICLRILAAKDAKASLMVQRQKAGFSMTQSHIESRIARPSSLVEQYFFEVVQTRTRVVIREDGDGALVQSLPGGKFDEVKNLDDEKVFAFIDSAIDAGDVKEAGEVLIFYECRCSQEMISRLLENMDESDRKDLFNDLQIINIECPRCSREYTVSRTDRKGH